MQAIKPTTTRQSDGVEKQALSTKRTRNIGGLAGVTAVPHPMAGITIAATKGTEKGEVFETTQYNSRIVDHHSDGIVWWSFDVDDNNFQKWGINIGEAVLPAVSFEFVGNDDDEVSGAPPKSMDIMIASHWSMIPSSEREGDSTWIDKLFRRSRSFGDTQTTRYWNLV